MAPPKQRSILAKYTSEVARSKRWREQARYDPTWKRMKDLYRGHHFATTSQTDRLIVNMAFASKNVIAPSVAVNNPRFTVKARKPDQAPMAVIAEEVLNYHWRSGQYQEQFRLAIDDWLVFGHGWMKVGYKFVTEPKVKDPDPEHSDPYNVENEGVDDREDTEGNVESERNVTDDRPFAERISVFDMFVDPDGRTMDDIRWIAQRIRRSVADVRVDKRYKGKDQESGKLIRRDVQPALTSRWEDSSLPRPDPSNMAPKDAGFVDVIEFYDLKRRTYCVFVDTGTAGFLIPPEPIPYAFGQPFVYLPNYQVPDEFYAMGELEQIETLQYELNETRSQMLNHRKRGARKYLIMEDAFDEVGMRALESDEDNTLVPVNSGQDIGKVIVPMPSIGTPPEFYNQSEMIQADMDRVSGVSDYMRGQMPDIRRTATEAAMLQDAMQSRAADKMSRVETFLSRLGERIIQLMQQYMTGEQVVRVVGQTQDPIWINYDKDYIQGDFDYEVEAGSTQPQNETFRRQSAMQMVDAMAPFVAAGVVDPLQVARHVLQFGFGVKDPTPFLQQAPVPAGAPGGGGGAPPAAAPPGAPPGPGIPPPGPGAPPPGGPAPGPGPQGGGAPLTPDQIPPEVLQELLQAPPELIQQLVDAGELPPEIVPLLAQLAQQGGGQGPPPGAQLAPLPA